MEELRQWILPALGLISFIWQIVTVLRRNSVRKEDLQAYAKTESLLAVNKVLQDQLNCQEKANTEAMHRIELMRERYGQLPTRDTVEDLREAIGRIDKHLGESMEKMKGLSEKVDDVRESVRTLDDVVRRAP